MQDSRQDLPRARTHTGRTRGLCVGQCHHPDEPRWTLPARGDRLAQV